MRSTEKEIVINEESYLMFSQFLDAYIMKKEGDFKRLLLDLKKLVLNNGSYIEDFWSEYKRLEKDEKMESQLKGIIFYFVAKVYARRKEFCLSLNLLEQAEQLLSKESERVILALRKEIGTFKLAYHYSEN